MTSDRLGYRDRFEARLALQRIVETAQKFAARTRVVFPCVFAVEDNRHYHVSPLIENRLRSLLNVVNEMIGSVLRRHSRIDKSDQVGDGVVAEDQMHLRGAAFEAMDGIKLFGILPGKTSIPIAREINSQASPENAFIRGHPFDAEVLRDGKYFF